MDVQMLSTRTSSFVGLLGLVLLSPNAVGQSDFYIFGAFGSTNSDVVLGGQSRIDDDDGSYALGAGYSFTRNFSLEAAYQDFGSHNAETDCPPGFACLVIPVSTRADLTGISLSMIGSMPITDRLDVYGKVGFVSWDVDFDGISSAFDDSGEDLLYGAGLRGSINDQWQVFAEYRRVDLDIGTAAIGLSYRF